MNTDNIDVLLKIRNDLKEQKKIFTENIEDRKLKYLLGDIFDNNAFGDSSVVVDISYEKYDSQLRSMGFKTESKYFDGDFNYIIKWT